MIELYVSGQAEVMGRLQRLSARLPAEMKVGMERLTVKLQNSVKSDKLSGQVLKVRTGRLRNSIARDVMADGATVTGMVSTPVVYARPHEYGFEGTVTVREHMRTVKQAFGRSIAPREVTVRQHDMRMNLPERSFLRSALADLDNSGTILAEMEAAIERSVS